MRIDAVFTWVDGDDALHKSKMQPYLSDEIVKSYRNFRTRFNQIDEIEFSVKSILKFAPFIRNIYIVTDGQTPLFLKKARREKDRKYDKVIIVDHKIIFSEFDRFLPTFNSRSIETMLYNIPDLSEHFIYFNDDFFIIKETEPTDYFIDGNPVLRGKWTSFDEDILYKSIYRKIRIALGKKDKLKKYGYKRGQQKAARIAGFDKYFRIDHTPAPTRKSVIKDFFDENPNLKLQNIKHKFRNPEQYLFQSLVNNLEIKNKSAVLKNDFQLGYIGSYKKPFFWYKLTLFRYKINSNKLFLNLQSLDLAPENKLRMILGWLSKRLD